MNGQKDDGITHVLWHIQEDTCFEDETKPYRNHCFIVNSRKIPPEKVVFTHHTFYYHETQPRTWNIKYIPASFLFGRSQLQTESQWISAQQFLIENHTLIHLGKNNTYVNGKKAHEIQLKIGDQIVVLGCVFYYFEDWILCSQPFKKSDPIVYERKERSLPKKEVTDSIHLEPVELEMFKTMATPATLSLFQTLSASSMMLVSTLTGMLIQMHLQPERMQDIAWMSVTSFTMAGSCILIGCMNRKIQNKNNKKTKEKEEQQYKQYVNSTLQSCLETYQTCIKQFEKEQQDWDTLNNSVCNIFEEEFLLPIKKIEQSKPLLILPRMGYEYQTHPLYQYLQDVYQQSFCNMPSWQYFKPKQKVWIQSLHYENVFIQFAWANTTYKWVWLGDVQEQWTWQDVCLYERQRLWIQKESDIHLLHTLLQKNVPYVIGAVNEALLKKILNQYSASVLYFSKHNAHITFDTVYSSIDVAQHDISQLRKPPIFCAETEKHWNQTFGIQTYEDLNLHTIRQQQKDLKIPIGFWKEEAIVLDLNDAHGLIAGTTGSGKSEFLMSLLFQLCVRFSAKRMQYILVDFKGGAFSFAFEQFAHCAGIITNLDMQEMERFQMSLQCEMEKRQKKIQNFLKSHPSQTAHIDTLNSFGVSMSHVFIIIDEFAQLKAMYPDMLKYLIEVARIGRSLGVHLILSTQKPSGIVDDQIWANSKFRICFRVQTPMDSKEVLMNDKACFFNRPGQFCLQYEMEEKMGIGLYSQEPVNAECIRPWGFVGEEDKEIASQKVSEYLTDKIKQEKEQQKWIVYPSLKHLESSTLALIDVPQQQCVRQWNIKYGESCFLLVQKQSVLEQIQELIAHEYEDIYVWNENVDITSYWQLNQTKQKFTLFLDDNVIDPSLFQKENVRLFCIQKSYALYGKDSFTYHVACSFADRENAKTMFQTYKVQKQEFPYALIQSNDILYTMKWKTRWKVKPRRKASCLSIQRAWTPTMYKKAFSSLVIGYDAESYLPIEIDETRPCILLYQNEVLHDQVQTLIHLWKMMKPALQITFQEKTCCFDIWAGHAETMKEWMMSDAFQSIVGQSQIVWLSYGCNDYVQFVRKPMVFEEAELIVWDASKRRLGQRLEFKDE